ncbi:MULTISPECIES: 2-dehydro-3-deoxygalactonokinase [Achromobacter]|uniref:2-dehydro-3-deoxygalactonokinase n=1 Tax=Achromobacter spanius TaxID=217203 RepID=A0ABY8GMS1_9BURK|nr:MULTISPECIES: 2-dehydro-3-deoxygalactonokinase [Achromobacter]WAI84830.1 2-dehydro-3-deoxygalactonokinase [Achromobacter spanius]WEX94913.1 2-dehydro-3-deoxygalactonokinase [Achromobacter sp. SS2-2022]WFP05919.1 2-dehydro-3-deoxygalactonokinase [Achromobacter spanius]
MTPATPARAALIALDWGTSSLRAYRLDDTGRTLDTRHLPWGIMRLPQPLQDGAASTALSGFDLAFEQACGDWLRAEPTLPVIACGMVGSAQGWQEAAYLDVPVDLERIGTLLTVVDRSSAGPNATPVHIVPGLIQRHGLPNVMRGEETQVFGVMFDQAGGLAAQPGAAPDAGLDARPDASPDAKPDPASGPTSDSNPIAAPADTVLIGLPGTHSKWVNARHGRVTHFDTFMTGEVYAALRGHTILGRTMSDAPATNKQADDQADKQAEKQANKQADIAADSGAFMRGVKVAGAPAGRAGVLSTIFSTRALGLTGELPSTSQADYLSGLLIGHEIAALAQMLREQGELPRIVLCGDPALCQRYILAMQHYGLGTPEQAQNATERGLWHLAVCAGLVKTGMVNAAPTPSASV